MFGYLLAILAVVIGIPLIFLLVRAFPRPNRTKAENPHVGTIRQEPAQEQATTVEEESRSRPSN